MRDGRSALRTSSSNVTHSTAPCLLEIAKHADTYLWTSVHVTEYQQVMQPGVQQKRLPAEFTRVMASCEALTALADEQRSVFAVPLDPEAAVPTGVVHVCLCDSEVWWKPSPLDGPLRLHERLLGALQFFFQQREDLQDGCLFISIEDAPLDPPPASSGVRTPILTSHMSTQSATSRHGTESTNRLSFWWPEWDYHGRVGGFQPPLPLLQRAAQRHPISWSQRKDAHVFGKANMKLSSERERIHKCRFASRQFRVSAAQLSGPWCISQRRVRLLSLLRVALYESHHCHAGTLRGSRAALGLHDEALLSRREPDGPFPRHAHRTRGLRGAPTSTAD